jgi:hypothetical protein
MPVDCDQQEDAAEDGQGPQEAGDHARMAAGIQPREHALTNAAIASTMTPADRVNIIQKVWPPSMKGGRDPKVRQATVIGPGGCGTGPGRGGPAFAACLLAAMMMVTMMVTCR